MAHSPFRIDPFSGHVEVYSTTKRYERVMNDIMYGSKHEKREAAEFVLEQIEEFDSDGTIYLGWQTRDGEQAVLDGSDKQDALEAWEALLDYA